MKFNSISFAFLLALAAGQTSTPNEPLKSSVQGLVVKEPGSQPLKKVNVEVKLQNQEESKTYKATTDVDGHFEVEGLEAGRYYVHVERPGFLESKRHNPTYDHPLTLNPGDEIKDLVFHMQPAAVITGKVLDNDGDPLTNVNVMVARFGVPATGWRDIAGNAMTDDLGEYRIGNLSPGKYLIKAVPVRTTFAEAEIKNRDGSKKQVPYPTYYPSTPDKNQAAPLELHAGDEVPLNLNMMYGPSVHIRGVITGLKHIPGDTYLMLRPKGTMPGLAVVYDKVKEDGSFEITNVLPGSYQAIFISPAGPDSEATEASQTIEVKDSDLDSLQLIPEMSSRIVGHIRTDNNPKIDWTHFYLKLDTDDQSDDNGVYFFNGPSTEGMVKADGSFEMKKVPPGKYRLTVSSRANEMQNYYVKTVNLGGSDVTDSGFTVSGAPLSLEVLLSSNSATIEGAVVDRKDQPVKDAMVVAVPAKELRQHKDAFKNISTDQRGHFLLTGLRPGEYTILSVEGMEDEDCHDQDFLKRYENLAEKVKVDEGTHKTVAAKLIAEAPQN